MYTQTSREVEMKRKESLLWEVLGALLEGKMEQGQGDTAKVKELLAAVKLEQKSTLY